MNGGKNHRPGRTVFLQSLSKSPVINLGIFRILKAGFRREGVGIQPIHQLHIQSQPAVYILGCMHMHIVHARHNQGIAPVGYQLPLILPRKILINSLNLIILCHQIPILHALKFAAFRRMDNIALQNYNLFQIDTPPFYIYSRVPYSFPFSTLPLLHPAQKYKPFRHSPSRCHES